jgi:hypothetical protein
MKRLFIVSIIYGFFPLICNSWGFTAHKSINYAAIFILPNEMFGFYKKHILYLEANAVKPDMRRYIDPEEGPRHFLDVDFYEDEIPLDTIPHHWDSAVKTYGLDTLKAHGIVPWHIVLLKYSLTKAFSTHNYQSILRISADLGHYISDLHVPLHSTENYNGQMTDQKGIHGLWESRLVELNLEDYDLFVEKATYLNNVSTVVWRILEESYGAKDSVLNFEKELTLGHSEKWKYTFEERKNQIVKTYSKPFSKSYHNSLNHMVERRLRASIHMVASVWMTAWIDAGQPILTGNTPIFEEEGMALDSVWKDGEIIGREERN